MKHKPKYYPSPENTFLQALVPSYLFRHIFISFLRPISNEQFFDLPSRLKLAPTPHQPNTSNSIPACHSHHPLLWIIYSILRPKFLIASLLVFLSTLAAMLGPSILKKVIIFLEEHKTSKPEASSASSALGMWAFLFLLKIFLGEAGDKLFFQCGIAVDKFLTSALTQKISRLPVLAKRHIPKGELMNYFMIDLKLISYFFKYLIFGVASPSVLLIATTSLLLTRQPYNFLSAFALLQVAAILFFITEKIFAHRRTKLDYQYQRINTATELLSQIRELRSLGYENLLLRKTEEFRTKENTCNRTQYYYAGLFEVLLGCIPLGIILWIHLKQQFDSSDRSISGGELYALLGYSTVISYPLKHLRSFVISTYDMLFALDRIEKFLNLPHLDTTHPLMRNELQPAVLAMSNIVIYQQSLADKHPRIFAVRETIHQRAVCVPLTIELSPGSILHLLSREHEARYLLNALAGMTNLQEGRVSYGGTMNYSPSKPWLMKDTVKQNILCGLEMNQHKYSLVCEICQLRKDMELLPAGQQTMVSDINSFSYAVSKKISLARHLYSDPDVLLLDDPFQGVEARMAKRIYDNIVSACRKKTILISCDQPDLLSDDDFVLLFEEGVATEFGRVGDLMGQPDSEIHHRIRNTYHSQSIEANLELREKLAKIVKMHGQSESALKQQPSENREGCHPSHMEHDKPEIGEQHHHAGSHGINHEPEHGFGHDHGHEVNGHIREPRISFTKYWKLFNAAQRKNSLILAVILLVSVQLLKAFANWWVHHISHIHGKVRVKDERSHSWIFVEVTATFSVLFLLETIVSAQLYKQNSDRLSDQAITCLSRSNMTFFKQHDLIVVAYKANKDFEDSFVLTYYFQTVIRNSLLFIFTILFLAFEAPSIVILGVFLAAACWGVYCAFSRAEREIMRYFTPTYEESQKELEQYIEGMESIRPLNMIDGLRMKWLNKVEDLYVIRLNEKYLYQALGVTLQIISMVTILALCAYGISSKAMLSHHSIHILTLLIAVSGKLAGIAGGMLKDLAYVENIMRLSLKKSLDLIALPSQEHYDKSPKQFYWPQSSTITVKEVKVQSRSDAPQLEIANLQIADASRLMLIGHEHDGVEAFKRVLSGQQSRDNYSGHVELDGKDIRLALPAELSNQVMRLSARPFTMTGTLRENIDPLGHYRDRDILRALAYFHIQDPLQWKMSESDGQPSKHFLDQRINFEDISTAMRNSISLVRALLRQPRLLICDYLAPNKCGDTAQELLAEKLRETTIISDSMTTVDALKASRILIFEGGHIVEEDSPINLLTKQTAFTEFVRNQPRYSKA